MCVGGSTPSAPPPPAAPPPPPPAPKPLQTAIPTNTNANSAQSGRSALRIDRTTGVDGNVGSGLNIPV